MSKTYVITEINNIGKYADFTLDDGRVVCGKYGYFSSAYSAIVQQFNEHPKPPYKIKLEDGDEKYFHVEKIFHRNLWVGVKDCY